MTSAIAFQKSMLKPRGVGLVGVDERWNRLHGHPHLREFRCGDPEPRSPRDARHPEHGGAAAEPAEPCSSGQSGGKQSIAIAPMAHPLMVGC
jgi:hypothetical protein